MSRVKLEFIVFLFDQKGEEALGIDLGEIEAREMLCIDRIEAVRESAKDREINHDRCIIHTNNDSYLVKGSYDETLKILLDNGW